MSKSNQIRGISRRQALKVGAGFSAVVSAPGLLAHPVPPTETGTRLRNTRVSLAAYSVRKALSSGEMDLFGFIDWCADLGLDGAELTSYYFKEGFDKSYLHRLKLRAFGSGVTISGTAVRNNFCLPPGSERDKNIRHVKAWIDHSVEFFAPHIRIFAGDVPTGVGKGTAIGWVADAIQEVLEHAEKRGVVIGLENHGGVTARADDLLSICRAVGDHPWFGVNLDTGNFRTHSYAELAMVAPLAVNVQIKAQVSGDNGDRVPADYNKIAYILSDVDYKGWVALEYEAVDPLTEIPKHLKQLKQLFEA